MSFASCSNGSTGDSDSGTYSNPVIDHSLGDAPAEDLKFGTGFFAPTNPDGIYITYTIPKEKNVQSCNAYIEGIGLVHENYDLSGKTDGEFFYPFVAPNKEYKVRFVFNKPEKKDPSNSDFTVYDAGETVAGWFETTVKAGANSKGEVRLEEGGSVRIDKNGDFRFTERPRFSNEKLLIGSDYDWVVEVGLNMGVSWEHGARRRSWWMGTATIPQKEITKTHNLYGYLGENTQIDFIVVRPAMQYKYNGKGYRYLWQNLFVIDCYCTPQNQLWQKIDINKSADIAKIYGKWKDSYEYDDEYGWGNKTIKVIVKCEETMIIESKNVTYMRTNIITKPDGSQFTDPDKEIVGVDSDEKRTVTVSPDGKTITKVYTPFTESISESFADWEDEKYGSVNHLEVKLFQGGNILRMVETGTNDEGPYEWHSDYKRQ